MGMREKLIELLKSGGVRDFPFNAVLADHLIANGVTIPVRCKDCQFGEMCSIREAMDCNTQDGYCSRGERRTEI
ncbi:MAG: hypothetical protein IJZ56_03330 [Oscillospiraceae bacterium]|nr:hypothetical protein [Oscillospiraceae bacterium]